MSFEPESFLDEKIPSSIRRAGIKDEVTTGGLCCQLIPWRYLLDFYPNI